MLPINRVAVLIVGLLVLQAVPFPTARAQEPNTDLVVTEITLNGTPVVDRSLTVTIKVRNNGPNDFNGNNGWMVFVGHNRPDTCIDRRGAQDATNGNCYIRFLPPNAGLGAGDSVDRTITWNPTEAQATPLGNTSTRIYATISPLCPNYPCNDQLTSPPDSTPQNNEKSQFVHVALPGVAAAPARVPPRPGASANDPWERDEIKQACESTPIVMEAGCIAQPGQFLTFAYRVRNNGNTVDTFSASFHDSSQQKLVDRGWRIFLPDPVRLIPGQAKEVFLKIQVGSYEPFDTLYNVGFSTISLRWTSSLNSDYTTNPEPVFPSLKIGKKRGIEVGRNDTHIHVDGGVPSTFSFNLTNSGNAVDNYRWQLDPTFSTINSSWNITYEFNPRSIAHNSTVNVTFQVLPPANAIAGTYVLGLLVQAEDDPTGQLFERILYTVEVRPVYELLADVENNVLQVAPGEPARFRITLRNFGNTHDEAQVKVLHGPSSWSPQVSNLTVPLGPFANQTITFNVTPPEGTAAETEGYYFVNFTSTKGPSSGPKANASASVRVVVQRGPNLAPSIPAPTRFVDPGLTTEYAIEVRNVGNQASNFTITTESLSDLWRATLNRPYVELSPRQSATVNVQLSAPEGGEVGETNKVFVTFTSEVDLSVRQVTLEGRISGPDLFVASVGLNATHPYSGDPVEVNVVVGNAGNKAPPAHRNVTLRLLLVKDGVERLLGEEILPATTFTPGVRLTRTFTWDTFGYEGTGVLLARIDPEQVLREIDETPASNEALLPVNLRTFDIRLVAADGLQAHPGEEVTYGDAPNVFLVEYRGNQPSEPVHILVESQNGWGGGELTLDLPRGTVIPILAQLRVPPMPGVPSDALTVTVVPTLRPQSRITATTTTTIEDEEPPRILSLVADPAAAKAGDNVTITARIVDATGVSNVRAYVVTPSEETVSASMTPLGQDTWRFTRQWTAAGTYRVFLEATDGSLHANVNTTSATPLLFTLSPGSAPTIRLAAGQETTIRTGPPIRLNITDPLGVSRATYTIKGISAEMPPTWQIETASFPAGTVEILVRAENIYRAESTAWLNFTVDNTAPAIRAVTLEPASPKVNEEATLRVETDRDATAVRIALKKDGQLLETQAATRQGQGVFTLRLSPAEGDYALDVTAVDAAGNERLQRDAVQFSAKPANAIPGLPLLGVALAACLAAVLGRRRGSD